MSSALPHGRFSFGVEKQAHKVGQGSFYVVGGWELQMRDELKTSSSSLAKEKDQLQTSYSNLTKERDQLQTSYHTLANERDQLQTSYNTLTKERD
ncbi:uncharacterized [Tachysurus ichikawai]